MNDTMALSAEGEPRGVRNAGKVGDSPILIVDDSAVSQRLAGGLIQEGMGRPVVYANNGVEALVLLEMIEPPLVLTDLRMPVMDGFELVEVMRARYPRIPVVLMTAYGSEAIAMRALKAGATNYVPKSCLVTDLVETLERLLVVTERKRQKRRVLSCQTARSGTFELENDPSLLPALVALVLEDLQSFSIGDEISQTQVAIAIQEALTNALYHGNLECSSDLRQEDERVFYRLAAERRAIEPYRSRWIQMELRVNRSEARIKIRDEGPGFDLSILDRPFDPTDLMRVGGRGMILIRTFLDEFSHNYQGNEITMIKRR